MHHSKPATIEIESPRIVCAAGGAQLDMGEGEPWCSLLCLVTLLLPFIVS